MSFEDASSKRIPLAVPDLRGREAQYLKQCIDENFVSSVGPFVSRFERGVAETVGASDGVATSSGTTGLHLALMSVGVCPGDLVLLPSFTFIASANAVSHAGAIPWLAEIDERSWTLDPARLLELLKSAAEKRSDVTIHRSTGRRIAAVMIVHTLGTTADIDPLADIAAEFNLPLIADAACALGVDYRGKSIAERVSLSVFSFNGNKTITSGGGGMVVGNDPDIMHRARHLCSTARVGQNYDYDAVGFNYRMTNIEAAVGLAQLERLDEMLVRKRQIRETYDSAFSSVPWLNPFPAPDWATSTCWLSGAVLADEAPMAARQICDHLDQAMIDARPFWKPVHLQVPYRDVPRDDLSISEGIWPRILTLPCSSSLMPDQQTRVIDTVLSLA